MTAVSSAARELARQVLLQEADGQQDAAALAAATERACTRLRDRLTVRFGPAGFAALLTRALRLARTDFPALEPVRFDAEAEGGLRGVAEFADAQAGDPDAAAGLAAILAHLVELLATFIGADLAFRLVRDTWPALPDEPDSAEEDA